MGRASASDNRNLDTKAVEIEAELRQIKSMADQTYNVTINVPEYCLPQVQVMMGWLQDQVRMIIQKTP